MRAAKISKAGNSKAKNNNRSVAQKIRETELAELLLFHPGGPALAMRVIDRPRPLEPVVFVRGDAGTPGEKVPRRFLKVIDADQTSFPNDASGRLQLAEKIVNPKNPLTARVFVNRVWGYLMGAYLVDTPSDFGLQGALPTHPKLLDWLAHDFMANGWSVKHLVKRIVSSQAYQQASSMDPSLKKTQFNMAVVLDRLGRTDEAEPLFEQIRRSESQYVHQKDCNYIVWV